MATAVDKSGNSPANGVEQHIGGTRDIDTLRPVGSSKEESITSGASVALDPIDNRASHERVSSTQDVHWAYNRAAVATDPVLPANVVEYFPLNEGEWLNFIATSTTADVNVQGMR